MNEGQTHDLNDIRILGFRGVVDVKIFAGSRSRVTSSLLLAPMVQKNIQSPFVLRLALSNLICLDLGRLAQRIECIRSTVIN